MTKQEQVIQHPARVCEIQIRAPTTHARAKPGQYVLINCPEIALHEFHPFTLTSAPEEDFLSIHVRCVGDFTEKLARTLGCDFGDPCSRASRLVCAQDTPRHFIPAARRTLPAISIDGPFGSASEDVFKFEAVVLCGAGIGISPFASILKSIWYRLGDPQTSSRLRKVHFVWICRDLGSFEWFRSLLLAIEAQDTHGMIDIHAYLTAKVRPDDAHNIMINTSAGDVDSITGLRSPLNVCPPGALQYQER